jgi:hypothetical protein
MHQLRATPARRDGHHHQLQDTLRNSASSAAFLWELTELSRAWRGKAPHWKRTSVFALLALTHLSVMAIAGIFSSRVTLAGHEVLARGTSCGWISNGTNVGAISESGEDNLVATYTMGRWVATNALEYARNCYNTTSLADSAGCGSYTLSSINTTTVSRVPCPFSKYICGLPYAIEVDTGLIDSNTHLGINAEPSRSIRFRKILTCVPLASDQYSSGWESNPPPDDIYYLPGDKFKRWYLGGEPGAPLNSTPTWILSKYGLITGLPGRYNLVYVGRSCV